jgi:hypothetical protein
MTERKTPAKETKPAPAKVQEAAAKRPVVKDESLTIEQQLRQKFPPGVVKSRTIRGKDFDYVAIDATIGRMLDTLGLEWSFTNCTYDVQPAMVARRDGDPVPGYQCVVSGELIVHDVAGLESVHWGIGADVADDLDKCLKTALAEALKKAGHQLGIGLYLWQDEERQNLARERKLVGGNVAALKTELVKRNNLTLGPDKEDNIRFLTEYFHVTPDQLNDPVVLQGLLGIADADGGAYS